MFDAFSDAAYADESGVSYWLPGRFSSCCNPGVRLVMVKLLSHHLAASAPCAAREIQIGNSPQR